MSIPFLVTLLNDIGPFSGGPSDIPPKTIGIFDAENEADAAKQATARCSILLLEHGAKLSVHAVCAGSVFVAAYDKPPMDEFYKTDAQIVIHRQPSEGEGA